MIGLVIYLLLPCAAAMNARQLENVDILSQRLQAAAATGFIPTVTVNMVNTPPPAAAVTGIPIMYQNTNGGATATAYANSGVHNLPPLVQDPLIQTANMPGATGPPPPLGGGAVPPSVLRDPLGRCKARYLWLFEGLSKYLSSLLFCSQHNASNEQAYAALVAYHFQQQQRGGQHKAQETQTAEEDSQTTQQQFLFFIRSRVIFKREWHTRQQ